MNHISMAASLQNQSRLLSLPPELRNHIWEVVLTVPGNREHGKVTLSLANSTTSIPSKPNVHLCSVLAILQTCRLVLSDAEAMFYHLNFIRFHARDSYEVNGLLHLLHGLSVKRRAAIENLTLVVHIDKEAVTAIRHCSWSRLPRLRGLQLEIADLEYYTLPNLHAAFEAGFSWSEMERALGGLNPLEEFELVSGRHCSEGKKQILAHWEAKMAAMVVRSSAFGDG